MSVPARGMRKNIGQYNLLLVNKPADKIPACHSAKGETEQMQNPIKVCFHLLFPYLNISIFFDAGKFHVTDTVNIYVIFGCWGFG